MENRTLQCNDHYKIQFTREARGRNNRDYIDEALATAKIGVDHYLRYQAQRTESPDPGIRVFPVQLALPDF